MPLATPDPVHQSGIAHDCWRRAAPWAIGHRRALGNVGPISIEWEDAGMDRLVGAPEALELVRRLAFDRPAAAFDAAFSSGS